MPVMPAPMMATRDMNVSDSGDANHMICIPHLSRYLRVSPVCTNPVPLRWAHAPLSRVSRCLQSFCLRVSGVVAPSAPAGLNSPANTYVDTAYDNRLQQYNKSGFTLSAAACLPRPAARAVRQCRCLTALQGASRFTNTRLKPTMRLIKKHRPKRAFSPTFGG